MILLSRLNRTVHSPSGIPVDGVHRLRKVMELVVSVKPIEEKCFQ
jgi:hypothetical protein